LIPEATRHKFYDAQGKPISLGDHGEIPTGNSPAVYLTGDASSFGTNKGTGGTCADFPKSKSGKSLRLKSPEIF
jgi:hypothetical protein